MLIIFVKRISKTYVHRSGFLSRLYTDSKSMTMMKYMLPVECVCNCMIVKVNYAVFIANNILLVSMSDSAILLWNVGYRFFGNLKRLHKTWILDTEK